MLVLGFAGVALILTTLGVYGVLAHAARRRTHEFGIRIALGSSVGSIYKLMLRDAVLVIGAGIAVGAVGTLFLNRLLANQLYEIEVADPRVLASAALMIATVAFLAGLAPTRRATRVDPMVALREE